MSNSVFLAILVTSLATFSSRILGVITSEKIKENSKTPNINFFGFQKQIAKIAKDIQNHQKKHIFASNKSGNAHVDGRILKELAPENKEVVKFYFANEGNFTPSDYVKVIPTSEDFEAVDMALKHFKRYSIELDLFGWCGWCPRACDRVCREHY